MLTLLLGLLLVSSVGYAAGGLTNLRWRQQSPNPTGQNLLTVVAGPSGFVAAGENGIILRSMHGASWEAADTAAFGTFTDSFHTGGEYTLTGTYSIITSPDGVQWTDRTPEGLGTGRELIYDVDRSDNRWAILSPDAVFYSPDGATWSRLAFESYPNPSSIALGPDRLVVGLSSGEILVRILGGDQAWTRSVVTIPGVTTVSVAYADDLYVARVQDHILTSRDAIKWDAIPVSGQPWSGQVKQTVAGWIAPDSDGRFAHSIDGITWENRATLSGDDGIYDLAVSETGVWVGVGSSGFLATSLDGESWIRRNNGPSTTLYGMARIAGRWIAGGANGSVVSSSDGIQWTETTVGQPGDYFKVYPVGDSVYLLGGGYCGGLLCNDAYTTRDGVNWTTVDALPSELQAITGLPKPFSPAIPPLTIGSHRLLPATVGTTGTGTLFASTDGADWEPVLFNGMLITSVGGVEGTWLAGDASGVIHVSNDLESWDSIELLQGGTVTSVMAGQGVFLASVSGQNGGIYGSEDGRNWERLPITRALLYGGSMIDDSFWFLGEGGTIIEVSASPSSALANLSVRAAHSEESPHVIAGFVVEGSEPGDVLIRAVGPGLEAFGVSATSSRPHLSVYAGDVLIDEADGWTAEENADLIQSTAERIGAFPLSPDGADSALLLTLEPGTYTAVASGLESLEGQRLIEVYDVAGGESGQSALINSSNRGRIEPDQAMVGGLVVRGDRDRHVLIRAIGPGLTSFGLTGAASDPRLTLWRDGEVVAWNDNWGEGEDPLYVADAATTSGAFELDMDSADAAIVFQAAPGSYTIHVLTAEGADGGEVLLEIYYLDR